METVADIRKTYLIIETMDIKNLLALSMIKGIGPAFIKKNYNRIRYENNCYSIVNEFIPEQKNYIPVYLKEAEKILVDCSVNNIEPISIFDSIYPSLLKEISDPPCVLFVRGNKRLFKKSIAIIGTRHSSNLGNKIAEKLGMFFSKDHAICNGLVEGIDEHSIYVNGNILPNVIGIISGGLCYEDTCSNHHIKIINDVLNAGGLIISEYYPRIKENKFSGSKASRIQAGLSQGLILVQSSIDGGSKYTISTFAKLGRAMGVIHFPSSPEYDTDSFSANKLIVEKRKEGIAKIIALKNVSKINVKSITILQSKVDYNSFLQEMRSDNQLFRINY